MHSHGEQGPFSLLGLRAITVFFSAIRLTAFTMTPETKIRNYILENYLFTDDQSALDSGDSFLDKGILDSTGILEVIYFLEEEFEIKIEDEEMIPENLDSVNNILTFLKRKTS
jgi:acyl carrier protein